VRRSARKVRVRAVVRAIRTIAAVLLQLLAALACQSARATDAGASPVAAPGVVWLELHADRDEATTLRATLAELCARLGLVLRDGPGSGDAVAKLSIDLSRSVPVGVVVRSGHDGRLILQRALPMDSSRPVVLESAATIAYTALETLVQESQQEPQQQRRDERAAAALAATSSAAGEPTITAAGATAPRPAHFGLEMAPLLQVRTGEVQPATAWGGGLRAGGGWRSVLLEPALALTGTIRQAPDVRTYSLRLSATVALLSLRGIAFQTGPSFAVESTSWSAPNTGMSYGMGPPPPVRTSALRPGWEAHLLVGPVPGVQAFLGVNGDCALAQASPPAPLPPMGAPLPSAQGGRCGLTAELGVAVTLFGAPAVHPR